MPSVLISGANRGIGLEFVRQYAAAGWQVHATTRDLARSGDLTALSGDITVHNLDVTDKPALDALALTLKMVPLDLLIANAAVTGPRGMPPEMVDRDSWIETFQVDVIAPVMLAGVFKPNLLKGRMKKAVALSTRLGSMSLNAEGGLFIYRSCKAALNAAWKSLSIDWRDAGIGCFLISPGWVKTDMGGARAPIEPADSITGMRAVIDRLTVAETGRFFGHNGDEIPW